MAIKQLFYDQRPVALLNPRASQRIDPRFKFTRDSIGTYLGDDGLIKAAANNAPRFDHDPVTGESPELLIEEGRTNNITNSVFDSGWSPFNITIKSTNNPAPDGTNTAALIGDATSAPTNSFLLASLNLVDGTSKTFTFYAKGTTTGQEAFIDYLDGGTNRTRGHISLDDGSISYDTQIGNGFITSTNARNGWWRCRLTLIPEGTTVFNWRVGNYDTGDIYIWGAQLEQGSFPTSYIPTSGTAVTRAADLLSIDSLSIPSTGSVYIDARANTAAENDTLISLKNASNEKINLSYESNAATYNSLALVASYKGNYKSSLPLPVPSTARERNIITWGASNYQYTTDSSRFATSLSSSVPANLTQLSIGHDAVDPTKAFNGYINAVYLYNGEITPAVAEALVRGELDPINADTYSPTGPVGSLALVINTQGATADGDKSFTLPAESAANDNDIVITWGDGTESGLDGVSAELGAIGLTHTYPAAGIYPVWVEGQLENLQFGNIANAPDLVQIATWGTTTGDNDVFLSPSTMREAFYGCTQLNFSGSARATNLPDTSAVTDWYRAFRDCGSITGTFPSFDLTAATTLQETWYGCSSMTSFIAAGDQTQNVTNFSNAWYSCSSLTSFPLINTAAGIDFSGAWHNCSSLTAFPPIVTFAGTNFNEAWRNCSGLTSFPLVDTSNGTNFGSAWRNCSGLTSFPQIDTSAGTNFSTAWSGCSSLTSFPQIDTSNGTSFSTAWNNCSGLTSFPLVDTSNGTNFDGAWRNCSTLTSFPLVDTSGGTSFSTAWSGCSGLTSFPQIDTSAGTNFNEAWRACSSLTAFPLIVTSAGTNFREAWINCSSLTDFAANFFDSWSPASVANECFYLTWDDCSSLTPASVVNILNSIAASGQSAPSGTDTDDKKITIDWDGTGNPATTAATAITTLKSRNWEIYLNDVLQ